MSRKINPIDLAAGKALLNKAFADLRKQGFLARQNFMCCGGCASSALGQIVREKPGKYLGVLYYHSQDAERLKTIGEICLGHSPVDDAAPDWAHLLVPHAAKNTLLRYGLLVEWDGTAEQKLIVTLPRAV